MMVLLKIARTTKTKVVKADTYVDMAGYAALGGQMRIENK
jgi:hypothetical protein